MDETDISRLGEEAQVYPGLSGQMKISVRHPETGRKHIPLLFGPGEGGDLITLLMRERSEAVASALKDVELLSVPMRRAQDWLIAPPQNRPCNAAIGQLRSSGRTASPCRSGNILRPGEIPERISLRGPRQEKGACDAK